MDPSSIMMCQNSLYYQNSLINLDPNSRTNYNSAETAQCLSSVVKTQLRVLFNPVLRKDQVSRIFDIIPGFQGIELQEVGSDGAVGVVSYSSTEYAQHALAKLQAGVFNDTFKKSNKASCFFGFNSYLLVCCERNKKNQLLTKERK